MKSLKFEKFLTLKNSSRIFKKAQLGQIIVYLLAIVIASMVLVFGYRVVVGLRQQAEQTSFLNFQKSLEADIKSIYFDYGSVKKVSYSVGGYKEACFADLDSIYIGSAPNIVINSIDSKVKKNVFLVNDKIDSFYVEKIKLTNPATENPDCINIVNGKLDIKLTGKGDSALVEEG